MPLYPPVPAATSSVAGVSILDGTAADITEDGTAGAGAVGKAADGGHIHPFAGGMWVPADNGWLGANADAANASSGVALVAGTVYLAKLVIRKQTTITNLWYSVTSAGVGASTGSFAGLYNSAGTKLTGSSDIGGSLTSTGWLSFTLTAAQAVAAGAFVYAAIVVNLATTQPSVLRMNNLTAAINGNLAAASFRWATNGTAQTSLPASLTLSSNASTGFSLAVAWN